MAQDQDTIPSGSDNAATSTTIKTKPAYGDCNHPAILNPEKFDHRLQVMIAFLHAHPIAQPLTRTTTSFPDRLVLDSARSSKVVEEEDKSKVVQFTRIDGNIGTITKGIFLEAIGIHETASGVEGFYHPKVEEITALLDLIGYKRPVPTALISCKKSKLPALWQVVIHLFVRCLSGKTGGTDCWETHA